jgi:hypothetical protein
MLIRDSRFEIRIKWIRKTVSMDISMNKKRSQNIGLIWNFCEWNAICFYYHSNEASRIISGHQVLEIIIRRQQTINDNEKMRIELDFDLFSLFWHSVKYMKSSYNPIDILISYVWYLQDIAHPIKSILLCIKYNYCHFTNEDHDNLVGDRNIAVDNGSYPIG